MRRKERVRERRVEKIESDNSGKMDWDEWGERSRKSFHLLYFSTVWHSLNALDIFAQFESHDLFSRAMNTKAYHFHCWHYSVCASHRIASHIRWSTSIFTDFYKSSRNFASWPFRRILLLFIHLGLFSSRKSIYTFYLIHFSTLSINHKYNSVQERFPWNAYESPSLMVWIDDVSPSHTYNQFEYVCISQKSEPLCMYIPFSFI